jgi:hypothetical protein
LTLYLTKFYYDITYVFTSVFVSSLRYHVPFDVYNFWHYFRLFWCISRSTLCTIWHVLLSTFCLLIFISRRHFAPSTFCPDWHWFTVDLLSFFLSILFNVTSSQPFVQFNIFSLDILSHSTFAHRCFLWSTFFTSTFCGELWIFIS